MIYRDIYAGPPRSYSGRADKRWIVIHSTQNTASAEGEASYAQRRTDGVSSHFYVDDRQIVQSLDTDLSAHHVGSSTGNRGGISYECVGFASWGRDRWLGALAWDLLAAAVRRDCEEHGIVPRLLSVTEIRDGRSGIMTHNQARLAWGQTTHTDPGPGFPMDHLVELVEDDVSARDNWRYRGYDYVNENTTTKDHQTARTHEYAWTVRNQLRDELPRQRELLEAVLTAVSGGDHQAVLERVDAHHAEQMQRLGEVEQRLEQAATERAELQVLLEQHASGELDAAAVVDELARRLAGSDAAEVG